MSYHLECNAAHIVRIGGGDDDTQCVGDLLGARVSARGVHGARAVVPYLSASPKRDSLYPPSAPHMCTVGVFLSSDLERHTTVCECVCEVVGGRPRWDQSNVHRTSTVRTINAQALNEQTTPTDRAPHAGDESDGGLSLFSPFGERGRGRGGRTPRLLCASLGATVHR